MPGPNARRTLIDRSSRALDAVGLLEPAYRLRRRLRLRGLDAEPPQEREGIPVPPPELRYLVAHNTDLEQFIDGGRLTAEMIAERVRAAGSELGGEAAILDFGCGCGRLTRHWPALRDAAVHGVDYNPELVAWCQANLPAVTTRRSQVAPPLDYPDASFDLVYAISVFTHLPLDLQAAWAEELRRVLKPGGHLLVTLMGASYEPKLAPAELTAFRRGEAVVRLGKLAGTNGCAAFHPRAYAEQSLLGGLEVVYFSPEVDAIGQDLYLARLG